MTIRDAFVLREGIYQLLRHPRGGHAIILSINPWGRILGSHSDGARIRHSFPAVPHSPGNWRVAALLGLAAAGGRGCFSFESA
jgi:hypothetical protein